SDLQLPRAPQCGAGGKPGTHRFEALTAAESHVGLLSNGLSISETGALQPKIRSPSVALRNCRMPGLMWVVTSQDCFRHRSRPANSRWLKAAASHSCWATAFRLLADANALLLAQDNIRRRGCNCSPKEWGHFPADC